MEEQDRISGKFSWIPPEKRPGRIPGPKPYRKPELRTPLYFIIPEKNELFFVNYSNETLTNVSRITKSALLMGDEAPVQLGTTEKQYDNVKPKEAVKIEHYDPIFDSDCFITIDIHVLHPSEGERKFRLMERGIVDKEMVLLWDNGEIGKKVTVVE